MAIRTMTRPRSTSIDLRRGVGVIFESSSVGNDRVLRNGESASGARRDRSILFVFQMVSADHRRDSRFVVENGLVDPGVVTLVTDHGAGALRPDQEAVGLDLQIAVDEVAVGADGRVRTVRQADGRARYIRLSSAIACC